MQTSTILLPITLLNSTKIQNTSTNTAIYTITANETCTFSISGNDANEFNLNGAEIKFKESPNYETKSSYTATVTATDGTNAATQNITVGDCAGLSNIDNTLVKIYPNPSNGLIKIYTDYQGFIFKITDESGRIIMNKDVKDSKFETNLSSYKNGIYYIEIIANNKVSNHQIVILN